jgi:hypothetical protein
MATRLMQMTRQASSFILLVLAFLTASCERREHPTTTPIPAPSATSQPRVEWVDPNLVQPGPVRRESLTPEQMTRIRRLQAVFAEVDGQSVEQWVDNFKRDFDPDRELAVWERMADAYTRYCSNRTLSAEAKQDVFKVVLLRSMAPEYEVLPRLKLSVLTKADAAEIMRGF